MTSVSGETVVLSTDAHSATLRDMEHNVVGEKTLALKATKEGDLQRMTEKFPQGVRKCPQTLVLEQTVSEV